MAEIERQYAVPWRPADGWNPATPVIQTTRLQLPRTAASSTDYQLKVVARDMDAYQELMLNQYHPYSGS